MLALAETPRDFLINVRICDRQGNRPAGWDCRTDTIPDAFYPWYELYTGTEIVAYGHWAWQGLHLTANTRGLDSGCVYGRALSGWWLHADRIVQVEGQR